MANHPVESFLSSVLPDIEYADAPQDYCDLEISVLQDMEPKLQCLRTSLAPGENCPAEMPPGVARQLGCDEQCPERRPTAGDVTAEAPEAKPTALVLRRAA